MPGRKPDEACTEFQFHKSQVSFSSLSVRNVIDYTSFRLTRYIEQLKDEAQRKVLERVLNDYKSGLVAVAWKAGKPVWLNVTKETSRG